MHTRPEAASNPNASGKTSVERILLVRNDNIGDLVCSIPAIQLFREIHPSARIDLLVNSYNAPVVESLVPRWVDRLVIYQKTKHVGWSPGQLLHLVKFYLGLRRAHYDRVILLVGGFSRQSYAFATYSRASEIVGYDLPSGGLRYSEGVHEVESSWHLACHACGVDRPVPLEIQYPVRAQGNRVALQITSRKPGNRWSVDSFVELSRRIAAEGKGKPILLWSPGSELIRTHPGDDEKAASILGKAPDWVEARPTATLSELMSVLGECRTLVTPDGGAMHLGAAMGLNVVALFGQSDPVRWRPWTPRARVLQSSSRSVEDISVDDVERAWREVERE